MGRINKTSKLQIVHQVKMKFGSIPIIYAILCQNTEVDKRPRKKAGGASENQYSPPSRRANPASDF